MKTSYFKIIIALVMIAAVVYLVKSSNDTSKALDNLNFQQVK
ncbi:MAG: hypothetical protein WCK54_05780 [Desulfuromonadales bacterium]